MESVSEDNDYFSELDNVEKDLLEARQPKKQSWSKAEDTLLGKIVSRYGAANWDVLAKYVKGRTGKQCRERYHNILDPNLRKGNWTPDEDMKILQMHAVVGNQWAKISRSLVGRTDNSVKNRFYSILKNGPDLITGSTGSFPKLSISTYSPSSNLAVANFLAPLPSNTQSLPSQNQSFLNVRSNDGIVKTAGPIDAPCEPI
jgi:transcriptional activator Myb